MQNVKAFAFQYKTWREVHNLQIPSKVFLPHDYIHVVTNLGVTPEEELIVHYLQRGGYLKFEEAQKFWEITLDSSGLSYREFTLKTYFKSLEVYEQLLKRYIPPSSNFFDRLIEEMKL
jgi:hypothetical protein